MNHLLLAAALAGLPTGHAAKRDSTIVVPLLARQVTDIEDAIALARWGYTGTMPTTIARKRLPADLGPPPWKSPVYFEVRSAGGGTRLGAHMGYATDKTSVPKLWLDVNGDRRFSDEEVITGGWTVHGQLFRVKAGDLGLEPANDTRLLLVGLPWTQLLPNSYLEGTLTLGRRNVRVAAFTPELKSPWGQWSQLLVDRDGDGRFAGVDRGAKGWWSKEAFTLPPAGERVQMADGKIYTVKLDADRRALMFEPDRSSTGTVRFGSKRAILLVTSGNKPASPDMLVQGENGRLRLPAGRYRLDAAAFQQAVAPGRCHTVYVVPASSNCRFTVRPGGTVDLRAGPPFQLHLKVRQDYSHVIALHYQTDHPVEDPQPDPRALSFTLTATDRFGNEVASAFGPDGKTPPVPRLRIASARGGAHQEAFEYG